MSPHRVVHGCLQPSFKNHFPESQTLPGTGAPSYHKAFNSQLHRLIHCLSSTSVVNLKPLWGSYLEDKIPEGTVGGHRVHSVSSACGQFQYKFQHRPEWIKASQVHNDVYTTAFFTENHLIEVNNKMKAG